jgi:N-acetylglucosaminylphosphatidylinositol deacetylase
VALLVVAHPDDETMFFGPTLAGLSLAGYAVHVLSLTTGDADGQGHLRVRELALAAQALGAAEAVALNHSAFGDGLPSWDIDLAAAAIVSYASRARGRLAKIITFDAHGVSRHPDHARTHRAVVRAADSLRRPGSPSAPRNAPVELLQLQSWPRPLSFLASLSVALSRARAVSTPSCTAVCPWHASSPLYVYEQWSCAAVYHAMRLHRSQWRWFRVVHVILSRYSYVNELEALRDG